MKRATIPRLSDRLAQIAIALDSGGGEAQLAFAAAERLDELEAKLRDTRQAALYMRSTITQVASLLNGERIFGMKAEDDPQEMAKTKIDACLRAVAGMDFVVEIGNRELLPAPSRRLRQRHRASDHARTRSL